MPAYSIQVSTLSFLFTHKSKSVKEARVKGPARCISLSKQKKADYSDVIGLFSLGIDEVFNQWGSAAEVLGKRVSF